MSHRKCCDTGDPKVMNATDFEDNTNGYSPAFRVLALRCGGGGEQGIACANNAWRSRAAALKFVRPGACPVDYALIYGDSMAATSRPITRKRCGSETR